VLYIKGFMAGLDLATTTTRRIPKTDFGGSLCLPNNLAGEAAAAFVQMWRTAERTKGDVTTFDE
jgi:hypothetical protein